MLDAMSASWLAKSIAGTQMLTAGLSAVHLLGFALVMASGLAVSLRLLGVVFRDRPASDLIGPATWTLAAGVSISLVTGALLVLPRLSGALANDFFRAKMGLLAGVVGFHATIRGRRAFLASEGRVFRLLGASGVVLWTCLALAAFAFILIE
jgi:hypothetical protein